MEYLLVVATLETANVKGNFYTRRRVAMLEKVLEIMGVESERLRLEWVSAAEGAIFADIMKDFAQVIKSLGPNPLNSRKGV